MRVFEYILKYAFLIGVTVTSGIYLGPSLLKNAFLSDDADLDKTNLHAIQVDYLNGVNKNYLRFDIMLANSMYRQIYYLPEQEHINMVKYVQELGKKTSFYEELPISLEGLNEASSFSTTKAGGIERLKVGDQYIIGSQQSSFKKVAMGIFGVVMILMGAFLFIAGTVHTILNIRVYSKTGNLPPLSNTIDDMTNGVKFLFGISSKGKNEENKV